MNNKRIFFPDLIDPKAMSRVELCRHFMQELYPDNLIPSFYFTPLIGNYENVFKFLECKTVFVVEDKDFKNRSKTTSLMLIIRSAEELRRCVAIKQIYNLRVFKNKKGNIFYVSHNLEDKVFLREIYNERFHIYESEELENIVRELTSGIKQHILQMYNVKIKVEFLFIFDGKTIYPYWMNICT